MTYQDYIQLGFKRINLDDEVHFNSTGNKLFCLQFKVNKHLIVEAEIGEDPTLYYKNQTVCELSVDQMKEVINRKFDML